jgi:molecular chaperone GrpE
MAREEGSVPPTATKEEGSVRKTTDAENPSSDTEGTDPAEGSVPPTATKEEGSVPKTPNAENPPGKTGGTDPAEGSVPKTATAENPPGEAEGTDPTFPENPTPQDRLATLERERDEYLDLAQRTRAEFENFRKRSAREAQEAERRGRAKVARELVPAVDNLERALKAAGVDLVPPDGPGLAAGEAEEPASREVSAHEALAAGVALVHGEIVGALRSAGVEPFDPAGEKFDPSLHEALSTRPAAEGEEPGVVVETLQRGYSLGEVLVRPARVVVSA